MRSKTRQDLTVPRWQGRCLAKDPIDKYRKIAALTPQLEPLCSACSVICKRRRLSRNFLLVISFVDPPVRGFVRVYRRMTCHCKRFAIFESRGSGFPKTLLRVPMPEIKRQTSITPATLVDNSSGCFASLKSLKRQTITIFATRWKACWIPSRSLLGKWRRISERRRDHALVSTVSVHGSI